MKMLFLLCIAIKGVIHADTTYKSEDFSFYIESMKDQEIDKLDPTYFNNVKQAALEPRPRLIELMRRIDLKETALGEIHSPEFVKLLHSQIDENLVLNKNHVEDGLESLRIVNIIGNKVVSIYFFDHRNYKDKKRNLFLTYWQRRLPKNIMNPQKTDDWDISLDSEIAWNKNEFSWLDSIFSDPMPPIDYPGEVLRTIYSAKIFEAVIIENGIPKYKWAIRSSHETSGFHKYFMPIYEDFSEKVSRIITIK